MPRLLRVIGYNRTLELNNFVTIDPVFLDLQESPCVLRFQDAVIKNLTNGGERSPYSVSYVWKNSSIQTIETVAANRHRLKFVGNSIRQFEYGACSFF
jgi:hypothetical protein